MKLYVSSAYIIGVVLPLLNPLTTAAISKEINPILNIEAKDHINENYNLRHRSSSDVQQLRTLQEAAVVPAGIWTSYGYGMAINSTGTVSGGILMYDENNISCIPIPWFAFAGYIESWKWIDNNNSTIEIFGYIFNLTNAFQLGCSKGVTPTLNDTDLYVRDALYDYDVMVQWFQELYPFFEIKNIDWNRMTQEARLLLRSNSSDTELYDTMEKVMMPLDDFYVALYWNDDSYFETQVWELENIMEKEANDIGESDVDLYTIQEQIKFVDKMTTYMEDSTLLNVTDAATCDCGSNDWYYGQVKGTTISYMLLFNFYLDPDTTPITEDLDRVFQTMHNMSSMIIDIRINDGGYDTMALLLASYFSSERQLAWTTRTRQYQVDDGLMDADSYYFNSSSLHFTGPVVVMMSESTVGSGESFALAMSSLSQVTFLGKQTQGALAMSYAPKMLPNGWYVYLPYEAMVSPNGTIYEGRGLSPDIIPDTDFMAVEERHSSTDTWLEMAIKYLNNTNNTTTIPEGTTSSSSSSGGTSTFDSWFHWMTLVIITIVSLTYWNIE